MTASQIVLTVKSIRDYFQSLSPAKMAFGGYLSYVVAGWLILCLPVSQHGVRALDNLFIATSAVSTTGLVTVSVSDNYTLFGQIIIMLLIQLGGIGYMTFGSFVILSRKSVLPSRRSEIGKAVFSLPASFQIEKFIIHVIAFTLVIELLGAMALYPILLEAQAPDPLWSAIFHSVSAFCTAGFGLYNTSFEAYSNNFWLNVVIAILSYMGAIGFIVCADFWNTITGKSKTITLTSKIILWTSFWLSVIGTLLLFINEPTIQSKPLDEKILDAFFQAMSAMTTVGFNTIGIGSLSNASLLLIVVLMVIGASPSGTGGGLKSTTFSATLGVMKSAVHGKQEVTFWGRPIPLERVWTAVASLGFYVSLLVVGTYCLEVVEQSGFIQNLFEAASALGTVGLSMGITGGLSNVGKIIIILLMFCGRLGPLTFGIVLFSRPTKTAEELDNDLAV